MIGKIYKYPNTKDHYQYIDLLFDSSFFGSGIGIEVKFRTIDGIDAFDVDDLFRMNDNRARQITNQLFNFIYPTGRLGLYAFVFSSKGHCYLNFLPHYVLQKDLNRG